MIDIPFTYVHLLDSEYTNIARVKGCKVGEYLDWSEANLKMHALLGSRICLSDIQAFDSRLIANLFVDLGFQYFLEHNQDFLYMKARPANGSQAQFDIATSGCVRAQRDGWVSSCIENNPQVMRRLGEAILTLGTDITNHKNPTQNLPALRKLAEDYPEHKSLFEGITRAVQYFASYDRKATLPENKDSVTYDQILKQETSSGHDLDTQGNIDTILQEIERFEPEVAASRSQLKSAIVKKAMWSCEKKHQIWWTAVQAWNVAVEHSLLSNPQACRGSGSVSTDIGMPDRRIGSLVVPISEVIPSGHRRNFGNIDFANLKWSQIADARVRTVVQRIRYQKARLGGDNSDKLAAAEDLCRELAPHITTQTGEQDHPVLEWEVAGPLAEIGFGLVGGLMVNAFRVIVGVVKYAKKSMLRAATFETLMNYSSRDLRRAANADGETPV